jgi:hypothetical protein
MDRGWVRAAIALVAVVGMYAMLGPARGISELLRDTGRLAATVDGLAIALWFVVVRHATFQTEADADADGAGLPLPTIAAGILLGIVTYGLAQSWSLPEERFHLPQYFAIALLMWWAADNRPLPALLLTLAVGIGDEAVQAILPNRTFDPRDLLANASCGGAAVLFLIGGRPRWAASGVLALCWAILTAFPPYIAPAPIAATLLPPPVVETPEAPQPPPTLGEAAPITAPARPAPYAGAPVVLITVDALRADHVRPWGIAPVRTPHLDRFSRESVAFSEALSEAVWTSPGIVTLLTGLSPAVHGVETRGTDLHPGVNTPLDILRAAGYRTMGFAGDDSETYRNLGFEAVLQRDLTPARALAAGLDVLAETSPERPFFAWLHLRQIHAPYGATPERLRELGLPDELPDAPILNRARTSHTVPRSMFPGRHRWLKKAIRSLYAAEVVDADDALGDVLELLQNRGLLDRAIVVLTADHGEELLEKDGIGHASTTLRTAPHPEVTRIPLLIRLPDGREAGKILLERFIQSDLMPTLFPLLGVRPEPPAIGVPYSGTDWSRAVLSGPNLKHADPRNPDHVPPTRGVLLTSSPCGWQCPPDRRGERIHAWVQEGDRIFCVADALDHSDCPQVLRKALDEAARRRAQLRTPVPSTP